MHEFEGKEFNDIIDRSAIEFGQFGSNREYWRVRVQSRAPVLSGIPSMTPTREVLGKSYGRATVHAQLTTKWKQPNSFLQLV